MNFGASIAARNAESQSCIIDIELDKFLYALFFVFVVPRRDSRREYLLLVNSQSTRTINQHIHLPPFQVSGGFGFPSHPTRRHKFAATNPLAIQLVSILRRF
jgi:hypothetical protein